MRLLTQNFFDRKRADLSTYAHRRIMKNVVSCVSIQTETGYIGERFISRPQDGFTNPIHLEYPESCFGF